MDNLTRTLVQLPLMETISLQSSSLGQSLPNREIVAGLLALFSLLLCAITAVSLVITSKRLANARVPFAAGSGPFPILRQHYQFLVDGPGLIRDGYKRFSNSLFEIPRTFRFGQVILCSPKLIEELRTTRSAVASPEPWIDQLLQISHVMPGYFPKGGGWPAIAKTTPGLIRGTVSKNLELYVPSMNKAILAQLQMLNLNKGECITNCFDFAYSIVARSGSFAIVGPRLAQNDEYLKAVKDHILGMIMTTRVQFLVPDCLKRYIGGFISRLATWGTRWDMHSSRKILIKHFTARAAEYDKDIATSGSVEDKQPSTAKTEDPVEIFRWLYEGCAIRHRWSYVEVIGELLLLQFAFIYTTAYGLYGALAELAQRPEYIESLREEVENMISKEGITVEACNRMVKLDSFLKECSRLHPPAAVSAHRVCVKPLELSNGTVLKTGSHVGVPSGWIHRSSKTYEDPDHFDCYRFVKSAAAGAKNTRFTDLSPDYLVFGMGVHACPGRWMASVLMKLVFAHLIMRFDIMPGSGKGPLTSSLSFEEFYVPNFGLKVHLRLRGKEE